MSTSYHSPNTHDPIGTRVHARLQVCGEGPALTEVVVQAAIPVEPDENQPSPINSEGAVVANAFYSLAPSAAFAVRPD